MNWTRFGLDRRDHVGVVRFNRADRANALDLAMWSELRQVFEWVAEQPDIRVVVLAGEGAHFCAGIDTSLLMQVSSLIKDDCTGRQHEKLRKLILSLQAAVSSLELCSKPVIAAIHGACLGGGLDIALAADFRFAASGSQFGVKELDWGMVADVWALQRLSRVVGEGVAREMALTGVTYSAEQARSMRLVNSVFPDVDALMAHALEVARGIAEKSPLAVRGIKEVMNFSRDHSVADGLNFVATWNAAMLLSDDLQKVAQASISRQKPDFKN